MTSSSDSCFMYLKTANCFFSRSILFFLTSALPAYLFSKASHISFELVYFLKVCLMLSGNDILIAAKALFSASYIFLSLSCMFTYSVRRGLPSKSCVGFT
ncbi:hypothetical protein HanIR_Chr12g0598111 [Helianthus annuus]|nr:hypothetical protein HanIR_Chr12g0598111 [Helianthus annuus]